RSSDLPSLPSAEQPPLFLGVDRGSASTLLLRILADDNALELVAAGAASAVSAAALLWLDGVRVLPVNCSVKDGADVVHHVVYLYFGGIKFGHVRVLHDFLVNRFELTVELVELFRVFIFLCHLDTQFGALHIEFLDQLLQLLVLVVGGFGSVDSLITLVLLNRFAELPCHCDNIHCNLLQKLFYCQPAFLRDVNAYCVMSSPSYSERSPRVMRTCANWPGAMPSAGKVITMPSSHRPDIQPSRWRAGCSTKTRITLPSAARLSSSLMRCCTAISSLSHLVFSLYGTGSGILAARVPGRGE